MKQKPRTMKVIHIVTMALLSTILFLGQVGMSMLPNIEPVTLLIILYTLVYKKKGVLYHLCLCISGRTDLWIWFMVGKLPVYLDHFGAVDSYFSESPVRHHLVCHCRRLRIAFWGALLHSIFIFRRPCGCFCLLGFRYSLRYHSLCREFCSYPCII